MKRNVIFWVLSAGSVLVIASLALHPSWWNTTLAAVIGLTWGLNIENRRSMKDFNDMTEIARDGSDLAMAAIRDMRLAVSMLSPEKQAEWAEKTKEADQNG